jgi:CxxC motif-containing protein
MPLLSVKTNRPVPKDRVGAVLEALSSVRARAPVDIGDVILRDAAGTGADIVATRRLKMEE